MDEDNNKKVSLNEIVEEAARMYICTYKGIGIDSKIEYSKKCDEKRYDAKHTKLVIPGRGLSLFNTITNMVCNSYYALIQKYGEDNLKKSLIHITTYKSREYDVFELKDNGIGMSEETKKRFFEEEYTTNPGSSGLGFIGFLEVLIELNGYHKLKSKYGEGTTFRLYLKPS